MKDSCEQQAGSAAADRDANGQMVSPLSPSFKPDLDHLLRERSELLLAGHLNENTEAMLQEAEADRVVLPYLNPIDIDVSPTGAQKFAPLDTARHVFVFVNPGSGGNTAAAWLAGGLEHIRLSCSQPVNIWVWDIRQGASGDKPGFIKLRRIVDAIARHGVHFPRADAQTNESDNAVLLIVAGGDGTVMWCVTELWAHQIDDSKVAFGVVPYGTGNDFARAYGWDKFLATDPFANNLKLLKQLVEEWLTSPIVLHDVWEVTITTELAGAFQKIDVKSRLKRSVSRAKLIRDNRSISASSVDLEDELHHTIHTRKLTFKMCNYFSMGVESRIGIGFDRHRTSNQFCNKLCYGVEGAKKGLFKKTARVDKYAARMVELSDIGTAAEKRVIFSSHSTDDSNPLLPAVSLIASNIPSFAAGLDMWNSSQRCSISSPNEVTTLMKHVQVSGDSKLEFLTIRGVIQLGLERAVKGQSRRLATGTGPFEVQFKDLTPPVGSSTETRIYFQVDGEFYIMTRPKSVVINHKKQIRVLVTRNLFKANTNRFAITCSGPATHSAT